MQMIPSTAQKINVGKNVGNHPTPQDKINEILVCKALEGKNVVRLKGGDPFLFGRGGEELELLSENNIPFEVVPGITSAISAATYAGIPVTHRDFCSSLHIITGHAKKDGQLSIDYNSLVKLDGTLIFMMSVSSIPEIAKGLILAGISKTMPTAVVENGTRNNQRKFVSDISNIASVIEKNKVQSPATIIVGKVCTLSEKFDWFSNLPLKGCNVLITRPKKTAGKLSKQLIELGSSVLEYPCIETSPLEFNLDITNANWIFFTSAVGVNVFFEKLYDNGLDSRYLSNLKIAVVGTETGAELLKHGIRADFTPSVFDGKHLGEDLIASGKLKPTDKVIIYRAIIGTQELLDVLECNNIDFTDVAVYQTNYIKNNQININQFNFVGFTSASCVNGFVGSFENSIDYSKINAICIGEQTADAAKSVGMNTIISDSATVSSMVAKIMEVYHA